MIIRKLVLGLCALPLLLGLAQQKPTGNYEIAVIVSSSNPISSLNKEEAKNYFLRNLKKRWKDGEKIYPADRSDDGIERRAFFSEVLAVSYRDYERELLARQYSDAEEPPKRCANDAEVIAYVGSLKGGIGYVNTQALTESALQRVKPVLIIKSAQAMIAQSQSAANGVLEKGRALFAQGRHEEALRELRAGVQLYPAKQAEFAGLIKTIEAAQEVEQLYQTAERAQARGDLKEARAVWEKVRAQQPNAKEVENKIAELDALMLNETKKQSLAAAYEQAAKYETQGDFALAFAAYQNLGDYKDAAAKAQRLRTQIERKERETQLEREYSSGLAALRVNDWLGAVAAFEKITSLDAGFRDTRKKLAEAKRNLERESKETVLARYYADGLAAKNRNELGVAMAALERVCKLDPNYRDAAEVLAEIENTLRAKAPNAVTDSLALAARFDSLSQLERPAMQAREERKLDEPVALETPTTEQASSFPWGGVAFAALALPLFGIFMLNAEVRARYHLWRKESASAARVYERLLARHPYRVKYLPKLARIYLEEGRKDESAMKVYRTVLQLNLASKEREEINTLVAQQFLNEGRTDSDAIEVLEKQLAVEMNRKKLTPA